MRDVQTAIDVDRPFAGAWMIVACIGRDCDREARMDPEPLFGSRRFWPVAGRSMRFRCGCGSRETRLSYTADRPRDDGPISAETIRLWL